MSEEKTIVRKGAQDQPKRKERNSITGTKTKLSLTGEEPGFHYAWINDDFVGTAEDAGYAYVTHAIKVGNRHIDVSELQGHKISRNVGGGVIAHLMRVPQEFFDEDMAEEQRVKVDASEERIKTEINSNGLNGVLVQGPWDMPTPKINNGG